MSAQKRLEKELASLESDPPVGYQAGPADAGDIFIWNASIAGPEGSLYEGGTFSLKMSFPPDYPLKPPKVRFTTKIYHPSINDSGGFSLDIFDIGWNPAIGVRELLDSLRDLLTSPSADNPLVAEIVDQLTRDKDAFEATAREWTQRHAVCGP